MDGWRYKYVETFAHGVYEIREIYQYLFTTFCTTKWMISPCVSLLRIVYV